MSMNYYSPDDSRMLVLGRTDIKNPLPLFWTGSGLEFTADGSELSVEFETDYSEFEQWIRVELSGATIIRMPLPKGKSRITLYRGLNPEERRHVRILKEMQALPQDPAAMLLVLGLETDGTIEAAAPYTYRIEVIGDSLTSGEGLKGAREEMSWGSLVHSTEGHYVETLGRMLNAEVRYISQGGWGVYISWDGKKECAIPPYYEKVAGVLSGERNRALGANEAYDFESWPADAVIVNLGTNDGTGLGLPAAPADAAEFSRTVKDFLKMLRRLNPHAYLLWAYGMCGCPMEEHIVRGLEAYREETGDQRVSYLRLSACPEEWLGSRSHPGPKAHALAAEEIADVLKKVLP